MQTLSPSLQAEINKGHTEPLILVDLYEMYASDYLPGVDGFDPADAIERFAGEEITWNGFAYRREVISRGDISRSMGAEQNSVSLTFSNISRYMATLAQSLQLEGLFCVIRTVSPTVTDDSIVPFTGRQNKPSTINKKTFYIDARQDFGAINTNLPTSKFLTTDPNNRVPSDPLYEGFRIIPVTGSFTTERRTPSTSFFGRLFGRQKKERVSEQYSSFDDTPYGSVVPEIFGSCQMEGVPLIWIDYGSVTRGIWVWGKGPISGIHNITIKNYGQLLMATTNHLGDLGGTGTNAVEESDIAVGIGFLSLTAYTALGWSSHPDEVDNAPTVIALIRGRLIDLPDSSGVYNQTGWSDNPVHIARFILTSPRFLNINPAFIEDSIAYLTSLHCDEPLIDDTNDQIIEIPAPDIPQAGESFFRYQSTGIYNPRYVLYNYLGIDVLLPEVVDGPYTSFDPTALPTSSLVTVQRILRKRYTCNIPITGEVRGIDFLYDKIFPAAKMFLRVNKKGKLEPRSEQSADSTRVRTATAVGATSIAVDDVTPWKSGPDLLQGRILVGVHLTTSEVRDVSSAEYSTAGNSVTLAASVAGSITATASGANLSGGSTSVQASGTVTIGGTPSAGNTVTVTINGIAVTYTLTSEDTTGTVAALLSHQINATARLRGFIKASWDSGSPTVVTIKAKYGVLNLSSALLKAHGVGVTDPSVAPTIAAGAGGALAAGTYYLAYADVTAYGLTSLTPVASVVLTANQLISITSQPAFPAGVTSRQFFMSEEINSTRLKYVAGRADASDFTLNALPLANAALPPSFNTTPEEIIRIAMSFATNSQDVLPAWRPAITPILNDVYLPTSLNGHKYTATTVSGATTTTEPTWPLTADGTVVDGGVTWTESGETVMGQAGLTRANIIKDSFNFPLGSEQSSINQIKIEFIDRSNDFAKTPYLVNDFTHQAKVGKPLPMEIDGAAIDNFHQMFRIANGALAKYRDGDWFVTLATGPQGLVLEEGDVICVSDDSGGLINVPVRIESLSISPNHEVTIGRARKYSTNMFSDDARAQTVPIPSVLRFVGTADSVIEFVDTVAIREADKSRSGFSVSVSRDLDVQGDWRGFTLYADYGDGYVVVAEGDIASLIGEATSTLSDVADTTVLDETNSGTFTLKYAPEVIPFVSCSEEDLLANPYRNLFLWGDEYIQAATIVDNGNRSFTISDIFHAKFDTECVDHAIGERVVYVDGSEVFVETDPSRIGIEFDYKAVTTNQDLADATPVPFIWNGNIFKEARPTNLTGVVDPSLNWHLRMTGHPRNPDIPGEYIFRVRRFSDGVLMRNIPVVDNMGTSFAAVFPDYFAGDGGTFESGRIVNNNVYGGTTGTSDHRVTLARSAQEITEPGAFVECTFTNVSSTEAVFARLCLLDSAFTPWESTGAGSNGFYAVEIQRSAGPSPIATLTVLEADPDGLLGAIGSLLQVYLPAKVRITLVGTQVRFYVDWVNANSIPIARGTYPLRFPLKLKAVVFDNTRIENIKVGGLADPQTIYSTAQQTQDNEDNGGTGPLNDITVEAWQVSPLVYPDQKGVSTPVTRFQY